MSSDPAILEALVRNAHHLVVCRREGTGGNYGQYEPCGTCPECEWRRAAADAVPSLGPPPHFDLIVAQRRARRWYAICREQPERVDLQRMSAKKSARARQLYADRFARTQQQDGGL